MLRGRDIVRGRRRGFGRASRRMSIALSGFRTQNAAVSRGAQRSTSEQDLGDSVSGDTRLVLGAVAVGVKHASAPDQVHADGYRTYRGPFRPPHRGHAGPVFG